MYYKIENIKRFSVRFIHLNLRNDRLIISECTIKRIQKLKSIAYITNEHLSNVN